ncbi:hypothetical protein BH20ACT12_BH20ACT12_10440 [soil metagenome]
MVAEGGGSAGRKTFALVLLCCASLVAVLDVTIVAIALPSVRRELGFSGGDAQWILTGYALSFGGLLLFMGRAGAATATLGIASLIYAVSEAPKNGLASPATLGTAGLGAVLLGAFVAAERYASAPLVHLQSLYRRAVAVPSAAVVLKSMVGAAQLYVLTLYFQDALGHTPFQAGLLFLPMTVASVVAAPLAGRLTTKLGARRTAAWGFAMSGRGWCW